MYRVSRRINFVDENIIQDTMKCGSPEEAIAWINKMLGRFAPINEKHADRILNMSQGEKVKFKVCHMSVSVRCS